ncbi:MAG TPA: DUF2017 family protein [Planctomycetota bacterium]|nr:DUF2017 family protein [Planctomycetota bacterium]
MARIKAAKGAPAGRWVLELPPVEASLVGRLPERLAAVLKDPDGNRRIVDRLFPASYSDPDEQREHRRLLGSSLLQDRQQMLADVSAALGSGRRGPQGLALTLDAASLDLLLRFVNDVRLLLATELGIDRNLDQIQISPSDKDAPKYTLLVYLGGLEALLVDAVSGGSGGGGDAGGSGAGRGGGDAT